MKSKVLLPAYILVLFLQACTKEDSMLNYPLTALMEHTENELSLNFINQMQEQEGSYQAFLSELQGATPLYEYIELAIAKDFGLYYAIPYTDKSNIVTGCICVPVERSSNSDNFLTPDGNLKQPIKMDLQKFNEDIPITRRYLYSTQFQRWQTRGLRVEQAFVDFAELLQKTDVFIPTSNSDKLFGESKQTKGYIGTVFRITISYQVSTRTG